MRVLGLTWETGSSFDMPEGVLLRAYEYYDEQGREFIGTADEIRKKFRHPVWRLTGIGKIQLEAIHA